MIILEFLVVTGFITVIVLAIHAAYKVGKQVQKHEDKND